MRAHYDELREASREEPGRQNPHVTHPWIAQRQALVTASTDEEAERIARRAWDAYKKLMKAHGVIPPHLQTGGARTRQPAGQKMLGLDPLAAEMVVAGSPETVHVSTTSSRPKRGSRTISCS